MIDISNRLHWHAEGRVPQWTRVCEVCPYHSRRERGPPAGSGAVEHDPPPPCLEAHDVVAHSRRAGRASPPPCGAGDGDGEGEIATGGADSAACIVDAATGNVLRRIRLEGSPSL